MFTGFHLQLSISVIWIEYFILGQILDNCYKLDWYLVKWENWITDRYV